MQNRLMSYCTAAYVLNIFISMPYSEAHSIKTLVWACRN